MFEVRLHGAVWKRASPRRSEEWRRSLSELNKANHIRGAIDPSDDPALEVVRPPDGGLKIRVYRRGFDLERTFELAPDRVEELFGDYGATILQMVHIDREAPVRGFEALDYAKRVIHDEAAGYLMELLAPTVEMDLDDARRLFTLVFLVGTDLPEEFVRYHRLH